MPFAEREQDVTGQRWWKAVLASMGQVRTMVLVLVLVLVLLLLRVLLLLLLPLLLLLLLLPLVLLLLLLPLVLVLTHVSIGGRTRPHAPPDRERAGRLRGGGARARLPAAAAQGADGRR